jgi:hypothetical protein
MGTINIVGTGGIIEGNLGTSNVNVNLDDVLHFDGVDDKIDTNITLSTTFDGAFTVSAWVKLDDGQGTSRRILGSRNSASEDWFQLMVESSGKVSLYYESNNNSTEAMTNSVIFPNGETSWAHIAATVPTSGNIIIYINGVAQSLDGTKDGDMTGITVGDFSTTVDLFIGCRSTNGTPEGFFKGYIADVRLQDSVLTAAEIGVLASKINVDYTLVNSTQPTGWYKLTNNDTSNSGSGGGTPTVTGTTRHYDEFSVDVYDNSTTTDGTFTVTQGKVEGLALTTGEFDGDDDFVELGSQDGTLRLHNTNATISVWINRPDVSDGDGYQRIIDKSSGGNAANGWALYTHTDGRVYLDVNGGNAIMSNAGVITDAKWHHIVATFDSTNEASMWIDGVENEDMTGVTTLPPSNTTGARIGSWNHSTGREFKGKIKDLRIYDYAVRDDGAASLYSKTYPVTPLHWWKLNEGSGTAAEDYGTATDIDGVMTNGATYTNGTLDLDSSFTMETGGTMSAPRGVMDVAADFNMNAGVWKHNNGTLTLSAAGNPNFNVNTQVVGERELYNVIIDCSGRAGVSYSMHIENSLTINSGKGFRLDAAAAAGDIVLTMGTETSSGTITNNGGSTDAANDGIIFFRNTPAGIGTACTIEGVSSLYPAILAGNTAPHWDSGCTDANAAAGKSTVKLKNVKHTLNAITTGGGVTEADGTGQNGVTIQLTGDCEFGAVTVSSGDELDINGQRAEFSGALTQNGPIADTGGGGLIVCNNYDRTASNSALDNTSMIVTGASGTHDYRSPRFGNLMFNLGSLSDEVSYGPVDGCGNLLFGSGTITTTNSNTWNATDLSIATGGTYNAGDQIVTVAGDFTTSGGLIGKSALTLSASVDNDSVSIPDDNTLDLTTAMTLEGWVKTTGTDSFQHLVCKSGGFYFISVYNAGGGATGKAMVRIYDGANIDAVGTSQVNDGKWHHIAGTYDTSAGKLKLYVDGKLEAETSNSDAINTGSTNLFLGSNDATTNELTGTLARASVWNVALTQAQIREMLFYDFATADSEGTIPDANCVGWWQFDEGTGTAVADSSTSNNDGTIGTPTWAGAGTFTYGTSTLVMAKSGTQTITAHAQFTFYNLTVNSGSTTQMVGVADSGAPFIPTHNVNIQGTLTSASCPIYNGNAFVSNGGAYTFGTAGTSVAGVASFRHVHTSGTIDFPACTTKFLRCEGSGGTTRATGDLTFTTELQVDSGTTFNANGNTINTAEVDVNGGTLNLSNSTLNFATRLVEWNMLSPSTLITGNTTVTGYSAAEPTNVQLPYESASTSSFEIVGNVSNLNAAVATDLTVIGSVTDCITTGTDAIIRQWHHTLDTQQLLDADEAGDDDLRLTKPALDNALELMTK